MLWVISMLKPSLRSNTGSGDGKGDAQSVLGACAVDVATGQMLVGQW
jgi:hypothetical protein